MKFVWALVTATCVAFAVEVDPLLFAMAVVAAFATIDTIVLEARRAT